MEMEAEPRSSFGEEGSFGGAATFGEGDGNFGSRYLIWEEEIKNENGNVFIQEEEENERCFLSCLFLGSLGFWQQQQQQKWQWLD